MKNPIRIALIQLAYSGRMDSMKAQYRALIAEAAARGANLVCLSEFSLIPYFPGARQPEGFDYAEPLPGGTSERFFSEMARQHKVKIVGSLYEEADDGGLFDTATVHDETGALVGRTRKIQIPSGNGYHETDYYAGSDQYPVIQLDALTLATPTCYDQWYPEIARIYALGGAELIVYPTAIGDEPEDHVMDTQDAWETVMRGHAIANGIFIAAVNRVGTENGVTFYGSSFVCAPDGKILARAGRASTEVLLADLDPTAIPDWRWHFPLLHQRRASVYGKILQTWSGDEKPEWVEETPRRRTKPTGGEILNQAAD
ncbi:MAG: hydrolase [Anaerolineales bacterium]|nr:hydrolase [Anaerolineales bacterium]